MNDTSKTAMNSFRSKLGQLSRWLHLWLGLTSGLIVFIVSITGCLYVFQSEIKDALEPWRFVEAQGKPFVPPSQLVDTALVYMPGKTPTGLTYEDETGAAAVGFYYIENDKLDFGVVFMNPYSCEFIRKQEAVLHGSFDFFQFIMKGHRHLWLPEAIGKRVVGIGALVYVVLLITGLIMWWPASWKKKHRERSFRVNWKAGFKRLVFDLHSVSGFYILIFVLIIACTGLVWSFKWVENSVYYLASGGESKVEHAHPHSDVSKAALAVSDSIPAIDRAWYLTLAQNPNPERIYMTPHLAEEDEAIEILVFHKKGKFYHHDEYFYDRYTLEPLAVEKYVDAGFADKLNLMNYDIHTGAILGLPGKILAFIVSLISASLPVTGFLVWLNKRKAQRKFRHSMEGQQGKR
ncbi:MAG: PepSY-associated TM helix domain-containing protein [Mangrovibacterium sp.]